MLTIPRDAADSKCEASLTPTLCAGFRKSSWFPIAFYAFGKGLSQRRPSGFGSHKIDRDHGVPIEDRVSPVSGHRDKSL